MTPRCVVLVACLFVLALGEVSALNLQQCETHDDCKYEGCRASASDVSGSCGTTNHKACGVCSSAGGGYCTGWKGNCYLYGSYGSSRVDAGNCDNCGMRHCPAGTYSSTGKGTGEVASPYGCTVCPAGGDSVEGSVNCTFQTTSPPPLEESATPAPDAILNLQRIIAVCFKHLAFCGAGCGVCSSAGGGYCTGWKGNCYLYGYYNGYRVDAGNCDNCGLRHCPAGTYSSTGRGTGEVASPYGCTVCPAGADSAEGSTNCAAVQITAVEDEPSLYTWGPHVWVCEDRHACANGTSSFFCFVFDEAAGVFVPWGPDSHLRLVNSATPVAADAGWGSLLRRITIDECAGTSVGQLLKSPGADVVYVPCAKGMFAVDVESGKVLFPFQHPSGGADQFQRAALQAFALSHDGTRLYIGSEPKALVAFNTSTGAELWRYATRAQATSAMPSADDTTVWVVITRDPDSFSGKHVCNLDASTGAELWCLTQTGGMHSRPPAISADGGTIYLTSEWGYIYSFDAHTFSQKWKVQPWGITPIRQGPTLSHDEATIFLHEYSGRVAALSAADGSVMWRTAGAVHSLPEFAHANLSPDGALLVTRCGDHPCALDTADGHVVWTAEQATVSREDGTATFEAALRPPATPDRAALYYATRDGRLLLVNATSGATLREAVLGNATSSPVLLDAARAVVGTREGALLLVAIA
ncbi:hypothetical protein T484DRAFT_1919940 [Baffinella frigidus]|nr:hypothetical protein T484DRAFT_1919940 [Cryptophyta sp. CCMP2293]